MTKTPQEVNLTNAVGSPCCGNCVMYRGGSCTLVTGLITPNLVCDKWEPGTERDS